MPNDAAATRPPVLFDTVTVAQLLNVHPITLAHWRRKKVNLHRHLHVGRLIRYYESDVLAFLESRTSDRPRPA